MNTNWEER